MDNIEKKMYDDWHQKRGASEGEDHVLKDPWYQTVMRLLPNVNHKTVLEIGTGRGAFAIWMAQQYPEANILGTDFSENAITIAQSKLSAQLPNLSFEVADAERLPYKNHVFDVVITCETLEHVLHPQKMCSEMYRVLKPGGIFILTTENYFNGMFLAWLKSWITGARFNSGSGVQPHENFFIFFKVARYLKKAGFVLTHTESNHYQWLLLPGVNPSTLCTKELRNPFWKKIFRPFGRHYTYVGIKPNGVEPL